MQVNNKKVLIVEDDPVLIRMYSTKLITEGFGVTTATNGEEGLQKVVSENFDIVVLDIMMPRMSGIDMLKKLREDNSNLQIPFIILTNLTEKEQQEEATRLGVKEFLIKADLLPSDLVKTIRKYL